MKYALLVYDAPSWRGVPSDQRRELHRGYHAVAAFPVVIGHYRFGPPRKATTIRVEDDQIARSEGPLADTRERLRALFLLESEDRDSALEFAAQIPAARLGGAVEVWPLAERSGHER